MALPNSVLFALDLDPITSRLSFVNELFDEAVTQSRGATALEGPSVEVIESLSDALVWQDGFEFGPSETRGNSGNTLNDPGLNASNIDFFEPEVSSARPGSDTTGGGSGGGGSGGGGKPDKGGDGGGDTGTDPVLLTTYVSGGDKSNYNVQINFGSGEWTVSLQDAFIKSAEFISSIIIGDVSDERVPFAGRVDDISIDADLVYIDGEGNILGQAAALTYRTDTFIPASGFMEFEAVDATPFDNNGYFDNIVLHEMLHVLGMNFTTWDRMGLVAEDGAGNLRFIGDNATYEYEHGIFKDLNPEDTNRSFGVLLEMEGSAGTAYSHWDEDVFDAELMTGWLNVERDAAGNLAPESIDPTVNAVSLMTIAALQDMGYETIYTPTVWPTEDALLLA